MGLRKRGRGPSKEKALMGGQPGKPKTPGNPPGPREPQRSPPVEEPPKPIPVPPMERPPPPMQVHYKGPLEPNSLDLVLGKPLFGTVI